MPAEKLSFMHLNTIQEHKPKIQLENALDTMKNIPSHESLYGVVLGSNNDEPISNYMKKDLETIQDDQSNNFETENNLDDSNTSKNKTLEDFESSVSSDEAESIQNNVYHKHSTLGIKNSQ
jgi:predicted DNA binding CopG/RHH family protein